MRRLLLALSLLAGCGGEAGRLLTDIEAGPGPSALKAETPAPTLRAASVPGTEADLWVPGEAPLARLVLLPGLSEDGRRDPRLVPLAQSLARARFLVLVPDLPAARRLRADASDAAIVAAAVDALPEGPGPAGLAAISYAAGPALLAAAKPEVGARLAFVATLGAYQDTAAVITWLATNSYRLPGEGWRQGAASPAALWGFLLAVAATLPDAGDRALLAAIARDRLSGQDRPALAARLSPSGRAVLALAETRDPEMIARQISALPADMQATLEALTLTPARLAGFRPCAILVHGEADPVIPWSESARLAALLGPRAVLHVVPGLDHIDPRGLNLAGRLALLEAGRDLLRARDGLDPCVIRSRAAAPPTPRAHSALRAPCLSRSRSAPTVPRRARRGHRPSARQSGCRAAGPSARCQPAPSRRARAASSRGS
jgi:hypothetical protein